MAHDGPLSWITLRISQWSLLMPLRMINRNFLILEDVRMSNHSSWTLLSIIYNLFITLYSLFGRLLKKLWIRLWLKDHVERYLMFRVRIPVLLFKRGRIALTHWCYRRGEHRAARPTRGTAGVASLQIHLLYLIAQGSTLRTTALLPYLL